MPWTVPAIIPLPRDFTGFDPASSIPCDDFTAYARHLPHWRLPGAVYFITFRLADSIPQAILSEMQREADTWRQKIATQANSLPDGGLAEWQEYQRARLLKLETLLDEGHGECLLHEERHRQVVIDALHHFEGQRCEMLAYAVMPTHVHVLCRMLDEHRLEEVCSSWKWFTAQRIQRSLGRTGPLWQDESFDRIIRDAEHYQATVRYIAKNPFKARLQKNEATVWFCRAIQEANESP